ncbi:MAG: alpha/beta hydrolase [Lachnospiraceae bacterium]|nr:alpha/beta hydrolase [Lachnospiraceae bacterium]
MLRIFGGEIHDAVKLYEDCVCYPIEELVALHQMEESIRKETDEATLKRLTAEFREKRLEVEKHRFPDAPEKIFLWKKGNMPRETEYTENIDFEYTHDPDFFPFMYESLIPEDVTPKGAVVMSAGGDHGGNILYECYQSGKELNELGYQCFFLMNRPNINPWSGKEAGADVARAIQYVRAHADKYRVPVNRIAYAGFSNGGLTGEQNVQYFSGGRTIQDAFPSYKPDELDHFSGSPDAFLCVYGPRFLGEPFDWDNVVYPPTIVIVGEKDFNIPNIAPYAQDLRDHGVTVEMHTFINCPHGGVGMKLLGGGEHPNFQQWLYLCDHFMEELYKHPSI